MKKHMFSPKSSHWAPALTELKIVITKLVVLYILSVNCTPVNLVPLRIGYSKAIIYKQFKQNFRLTVTPNSNTLNDCLKLLILARPLFGTLGLNSIFKLCFVLLFSNIKFDKLAGASCSKDG